MIISKILNNNALICIENDEEVIVRGKGISYKKSCGDEIESAAIEKIYRLDNSVKSKFEELVSQIDFKYLDLAEEIIQYATINMGVRLNDIIYISLSDHIAYTIERAKAHTLITNPLLIDIKRFYPDEFNIGLHAIKLIKEKENIQLNEDEAGFIALNIVNAQINSEKPIAYETTRLIQNILNIIRLRLNITYNEDSVYYYRFITHLKFFAQRLFLKEKNNDNFDDSLFNIVKEQYVKSFECVQYIGEFVKNNFDYILSQDELLYLTIHVHRIAYRYEKEE
ncbi:BglG family transcription antiterminator LicT [Traorella massiliensis]|uniref:BglG family transcription antiterminator LicT n=1 Tax=Traorella massiliensis TaxID=1903263 RepID=UPI0008F85204|nr:PRD domain-containing protein [Traorella massiliensis]